jgi:hypothetical protein
MQESLKWNGFGRRRDKKVREINKYIICMYGNTTMKPLTLYNQYMLIKIILQIIEMNIFIYLCTNINILILSSDTNSELPFLVA